jgi:hypothetical protein
MRITRRLILALVACVLEAGFAAAQTKSPAQPVAASAPVAQQVRPTTREPFAFADFTWLSGSPRTSTSPLSSAIITGEFRVDSNVTSSFNHPVDHTIVGSSEVFRSGEFQLTHLGVGGDLHYEHVQGRLMTQFGMYSQTTPRNDASPARGQWDLAGAYRYISEAYGGYHFDTLHGINVQAGIFMSYVGLWSYYNFDNWTYQPSYVSSNTPWFFNGLRVQIFPNEHLKIEPWIINGWQSYGTFNHAPGFGGQVLWRPSGSLSISLNNYWGSDTPGRPGRKRLHSDNSLQWKFLDRPGNRLSKAAMTFTDDTGCEYGGGVSCRLGTAKAPSQYLLGFMANQRIWFDDDHLALTVGGGVTPPGGNTGTPASAVPGWTPDLRKSEARVTAALLVKF